MRELTAEQRAQLRERYQQHTAPKCHICGAEMTIQRAGGGSLVYGCTGRVDSDGDGYVFAEGRDFADNHYALSRVTVANNSDPDVMALLDELEAGKEQIKTLESRNRRLDGIIGAAERRIAELECEVNFKSAHIKELQCEMKLKSACDDDGINLTVEG